MPDELTKAEAIKYLGISPKYFENYLTCSKEISGYQKPNRRWYFNKEVLDRWNNLKKSRTINLTLEEYEKCFEFAIKMVYGGLSLNGIRGQRTEVQGADDVILGILAEHAVRRLLREKFNTEIELDEEVHPGTITPQDFHKIKVDGVFITPRLGVGIKSSKMKSGFLVLGGNEYEFEGRRSDVYIFARVGLPSDHLFRILREHSFFGKVRKFLDETTDSKFRKIEKLEKIPVWICGFVYANELEKASEIPGQKFSGKGDNPGYRYVKSVRDLHNTDTDWKNLISKL